MLIACLEGTRDECRASQLDIFQKSKVPPLIYSQVKLG